nr:MAG TPA: hypothetical protein [Caudoviricetes sp.]
MPLCVYVWGTDEQVPTPAYKRGCPGNPGIC